VAVKLRIIKVITDVGIKPASFLSSCFRRITYCESISHFLFVPSCIEFNPLKADEELGFPLKADQSASLNRGEPWAEILRSLLRGSLISIQWNDRSIELILKVNALEAGLMPSVFFFSLSLSRIPNKKRIAKQLMYAT